MPTVPRNATPVAAAAAAVLVAAVGAALVAGLAPDDGAPSGDRRAAARDPAGTPGFDGTTRRVSWRGVEAEVPATWPDASGPGSDWCASEDGRGGSLFPAQPYVARDLTYAATLGIGCPEGDAAPTAFGAAPERYWAPHLTFGPAMGGAPDGAVTHDGWTSTTRTVAGVTLALLTDAATAHLVEPILDSAHAVDTDANGCDSTSAVQAVRFVRPDPAFDVTDVEGVDAISVCQYDRSAGVSAPGLLGSRRIDGGAAQDLLEAIRSAPAGGGPDTPQSCIHDAYGDTALVVRLHAGGAARDLYVYYEWCFGNGFDDGTTRRELTHDSCRPLWGGRVTMWSGSSAPYRRCQQ